MTNSLFEETSTGKVYVLLDNELRHLSPSAYEVLFTSETMQPTSFTKFENSSDAPFNIGTPLYEKAELVNLTSGVHLIDKFPVGTGITLRHVTGPQQMSTLGFDWAKVNGVFSNPNGYKIGSKLFSGTSEIDVIMGMDNDSANKAVSNVYSSLYPNIFKSTFSFNENNINHVEFDIFKTPIIDFSQTTSLNVFKLNFTAHLIIDLIIPKKYIPNPLKVDVNFESEVRITSSNNDHQNLLSFEIFDSKMKVVKGSLISDLTVDALILLFKPKLIEYLNSSLINKIQIPGITYSSLKISMPTPAIQNPNFMTYSSIGTVQSAIPSSNEWPANCVFMGMDLSVINAALDASGAFPLGPKDNFDEHGFSGQVSAQLHRPTDIQINNDGSISAKLIADVSAKLGYHKINFGPTAQASMPITFKASLDSNELEIKIDNVGIPTFHISFNLPHYKWYNPLYLVMKALNELLGLLGGALNDAFGTLIKTALLALPNIRICKIPTVSFKVANNNFNVQLNNAHTSKHNSLLMIKTNATIQAKSTVISENEIHANAGLS
jgi:hypothetical protein